MDKDSVIITKGNFKGMIGKHTANTYDNGIKRAVIEIDGIDLCFDYDEFEPYGG